MKFKVLLFAILFGLTIPTFAQIHRDQNGNINNSIREVARQSVISLKSASNSATVIHQIPCPTTALGDIAFDGTSIWVAGYNNFQLFKISPLTGAIIKTIPSNIMRAYGLEFTNGFLFVADADNHIIQQVDTANGTVINTFPTPNISGYPQGLAWDGQNLWHNDAMATSGNPFDTTYKISTGGQIIERHHAFGTYVTGLAWDGQFLWSSNNPLVEIYKINTTTFTVVDTLAAPGGSYPNGLAFDGQYLWVGNNDSDSLYQVDIEFTSGFPHQNGSDIQELLIYPNPASDQISVELQKEKVGSTYFITNQAGQQIMTGVISKETTTIDLKQLSTGIYFFQVEGINKHSFKILKAE